MKYLKSYKLFEELDNTTIVQEELNKSTLLNTRNKLRDFGYHDRSKNINNHLINIVFKELTDGVEMTKDSHLIHFYKNGKQIMLYVSNIGYLWIDNEYYSDDINNENYKLFVNIYVIPKLNKHFNIKAKNCNFTNINDIISIMGELS